MLCCTSFGLPSWAANRRLRRRIYIILMEADEISMAMSFFIACFCSSTKSTPSLHKAHIHYNMENSEWQHTWRKSNKLNYLHLCTMRRWRRGGCFSLESTGYLGFYIFTKAIVNFFCSPPVVMRDDLYSLLPVAWLSAGNWISPLEQTLSKEANWRRVSIS